MQTTSVNQSFEKLFINKPELLNRIQAADYIGVTPRTLAVWACVKRYNLPYVKVGRLVKYRRADLDAFLVNNIKQQ